MHGIRIGIVEPEIHRYYPKAQSMLLVIVHSALRRPILTLKNQRPVFAVSQKRQLQ